MTQVMADPTARAEFPLHPPRSWFEEMPTWFTPGDKLTVQTTGPDAGRVAASVAPRGQCILDGTNDCWTAPYSPTKYAGAHQGDTMTAEGIVLHTANLGGSVNHARISETFQGAVDHYSNTASQLMRVRYHDLDSHIIALGAIWPDVTDLNLAVIRASAVSGDWRFKPELNAFDFTGAQLVNTPGFPLLRKAASLGGQPVYVGGLGGVAPIEDEPCPSCGQTLGDWAQRVADLRELAPGELDTHLAALEFDIVRRAQHH